MVKRVSFCRAVERELGGAGGRQAQSADGSSSRSSKPTSGKVCSEILPKLFKMSLRHQTVINVGYCRTWLVPGAGAI
jgi:hypothetical protein